LVDFSVELERVVDELRSLELLYWSLEEVEYSSVELE
jgi:hypothetical protein